MHHLMASERPFWRNFLLTRKIGTGKKKCTFHKGSSSGIFHKHNGIKPQRRSKIGHTGLLFSFGQFAFSCDMIILYKMCVISWESSNFITFHGIYHQSIFSRSFCSSGRLLLKLSKWSRVSPSASQQENLEGTRVIKEQGKIAYVV